MKLKHVHSFPTHTFVGGRIDEFHNLPRGLGPLYVDSVEVGQVTNFSVPFEQRFGRIPNSPRAHVIDYDGRQVNHQMLDYAYGLWNLWRHRNLSHRPVAGARKRKAALKRAATR